MSTAGPPRHGQLFAAGVLAGGAGVATGLATAWALDAATGPIDAVASEVRDLTPGPLANGLVHLVGHADKPLLLAGTTLILLGLCGVAGLLSGRGAWRGTVLLLALAVLGLLAVVDRPHTDAGSVLAVVVGLFTWLIVLRLLTPVSGDLEVDGSRRAFLARGGTVAVLAVGVVVLGRFASRGRRRVEEARRLLRLPLSRGRVPDGAAVGVPGTAGWRTPVADFYRVDTVLSPPSISPAQWRLRVHGMVDREIELTYDELVDLRLTGHWTTLCCVSNEVGGPLIGNAWWSGVPVRDILDRAVPHPDADAVKQTSWDGWTCGTPLAALTDPHRRALLAVGMNGSPLPVEHGFPVRTVVPGLYGYVSATKWVVDLEVTRFDRFEAYWTRQGWAPHGPVKTESRIDVPGDGASVAAGRTAVAGVAWSQHTGIAGVELQVDGAPWQPARLGAVPGEDTWVQWVVPVDLDPGRHTLAVRATDRSGYTQTSVRRGVLPDGATGWHTIHIDAT